MYTALEAKKDQLLIHAIVVLRDIVQAYEFPRAKAVVAQYDQLVKDMLEQDALNDEAKWCEVKNIKKEGGKCPSCADTLGGVMSEETEYFADENQEEPVALVCNQCGYRIDY